MTFPPETLALMDAIAQNPSPPIVTKPDLSWRDELVTERLKPFEHPMFGLTAPTALKELTDLQLRAIIVYLYRGDLAHAIQRHMLEYNKSYYDWATRAHDSQEDAQNRINNIFSKLISDSLDECMKSFMENERGPFFKKLTREANYRKLTW